MLRYRLAKASPPVALVGVSFPLTSMVAATGVAPGVAMGALLRDLRQWWLDGGCLADAAACRAELARRLGSA